MNQVQSIPMPRLDQCDRQTLADYFENSWELEEILMKSLVGDETFYIGPDSLRNPLIFYLGHSPVFYINKLMQVGLMTQRINPRYEVLFEIGVDPKTPTELQEFMKDIDWPQLEDVWRYRDQAKEEINNVINQAEFDRAIDAEHPLWALMMGMEHNRVHFETTSMLLRQFPVERVERPAAWQYAPADGATPTNNMIQVAGGSLTFGKSTDSTTYGWDCDYGRRQVEVQPFGASQHLITNGEFLRFVEAGGYENRELWDAEAWQWKTEYDVTHPKFWIPNDDGLGYRYRAMFDEIDLPLDWPVEVNHYEAMAYCRAQGEGIRLMTEAEWNIAAGGDRDRDYNLNVKYGSPSPVGHSETAATAAGLHDIRGNVWEWLGDDFNPLPGFKPHPLYADGSAPFFDDEHKMMLGGSWASNGSMAARSYRNWFRPCFHQHAGFRIAQDV